MNNEELIKQGWTINTGKCEIVDKNLMLEIYYADGHILISNCEGPVFNWFLSTPPSRRVLAYRLLTIYDYFEGIEYTKLQDHENDTPSEPEWSGEGLPPVGTVCEVKVNKDAQGFLICTVICLSDEWAVMLIKPIGEVAYKLAKLEFRPIQSKRDKVIEAGAQAINYGGMTDNIDHARKIATKLYDLGMIVIGEDK